MAFMMKKKRYKFLVQCCVEGLTEVPLLAAVLFAKVRLMDGGSFQDLSPREEVKNHSVTWNATFQFVCKMSANASTGVLDPCVLRISVRKECKGGRSYQKLGFVDVNLAELAGAGEAARRCLLEGYDLRHRQDNSTLRLRIRMNMQEGDPLFKVPSPSLKHKQLVEHLESSLAGTVPPPEAPAAPPAVPPATVPPAAAAAAAPAAASVPADQPASRDDCGSSIASGSSGFGSLPKKRPALFGSELLSRAEQTQTSIMSTELQVAGLGWAEAEQEGRGEEEQHATLQRQRSGDDMLDGCIMSHSAAASQCPACQGHTHSRNSSNTSGEMSSKASGYGSSLSQQSQHSRQSSEGGDSSEGARHNPATHIRRLGPKLIIDRNRPATTPDRSAESYHTPDSTIEHCLRSPIGSPSSDNSNFATPNNTILSPILPADRKQNNFAVPSYFDRKKQDIVAIAKSAANVLPLSNFQILKQKSLNTIPDFIDRQAMKEKQKNNDSNGLFHNFPFLTPLANRKNSTHEKNRLSSCTEDEFYNSADYDVELRHPHSVKSDARTVSLHSALRNDTAIPPFGHSTPKACKESDDVFTQPNSKKAGIFTKQTNNGTSQSRFASNKPNQGHELRTSKSGIVTGDVPESFNPLRHSYTANCVDQRRTASLRLHSQGALARNPSGGCLVVTETGSLDRAKAALERRKHKTSTTAISSAASESDQGGHTVSGRVENTRVKTDSIIDELLKATNLEQVEDNAETSGLQLFIAKDGTAALGSRQIKSQMSQGVGAFQQVVMEAKDDR